MTLSDRYSYCVTTLRTCAKSKLVFGVVVKKIQNDVLLLIENDSPSRSRFVQTVRDSCCSLLLDVDQPKKKFSRGAANPSSFSR